MEGFLLIKAVAALLLTLGLVWLAAFALRYIAARSGGAGLVAVKNSRLKICESRMLDMKHRLMVIACDDKEYVVLLGQNTPPQVVDRLTKARKIKE